MILRTKSANHMRRLLKEDEQETITKLRFKVEQLEDQLRRERRRADQHADALAFARRELMDYQQRQAQRGNGVGR